MDWYTDDNGNHKPILSNNKKQRGKELALIERKRQAKLEKERREKAKTLNDNRFNSNPKIKELRNKLNDLENKRQLAKEDNDQKLQDSIDEQIELLVDKLYKAIKYEQQGGAEEEYKKLDPFGEYYEKRMRRYNRKL